MFISIKLVAFAFLWSILEGLHIQSVQGHELDERQDIENTSSPPPPPPELVTVPVFCVETSRCKKMDPARNFSFVHISKSGGASWKQELKNTLGHHTIAHEYSVAYQNSMNIFDFLSYHLTSLRSPRHHVWSLFTECKYAPWGKKVTKNTSFPRSSSNATPADDDIHDYRLWLLHFLSNANHSMPIRKENSFGCYRPANYLTNALTNTVQHVGHKGDTSAILEPDFLRSLRVYEFMDWVALTDFFHESKCLLYHRLEPKTEYIKEYIEEKCRCDNSSQNYDGQNTRSRKLHYFYDRNKFKVKASGGNAGTSTTSDDNKKNKNNIDGENNSDVHKVHHAEGHRSSMLDLPADVLELVNALTRVDQQLYRVALERFLGEIVWLEGTQQLGRRVLCDNVLDRWEPELAYLNISITLMYESEKSRLVQI